MNTVIAWFSRPDEAIDTVLKYSVIPRGNTAQVKKSIYERYSALDVSHYKIIHAIIDLFAETVLHIGRKHPGSHRRIDLNKRDILFLKTKNIIEEKINHFSSSQAGLREVVSFQRVIRKSLDILHIDGTVTWKYSGENHITARDLTTLGFGKNPGLLAVPNLDTTLMLPTSYRTHEHIVNLDDIVQEMALSELEKNLVRCHIQNVSNEKEFNQLLSRYSQLIQRSTFDLINVGYIQYRLLGLWDQEGICRSFISQYRDQHFLQEEPVIFSPGSRLRPSRIVEQEIHKGESLERRARAKLVAESLRVSSQRAQDAVEQTSSAFIGEGAPRKVKAKPEAYVYDPLKGKEELLDIDIFPPEINQLIEEVRSLLKLKDGEPLVLDEVTNPGGVKLDKKALLKIKKLKGYLFGQKQSEDLGKELPSSSRFIPFIDSSEESPMPSSSHPAAGAPGFVGLSLEQASSHFVLRSEVLELKKAFSSLTKEHEIRQEEMENLQTQLSQRNIEVKDASRALMLMESCEEELQQMIKERRRECFDRSIQAEFLKHKNPNVPQYYQFIVSRTSDTILACQILRSHLFSLDGISLDFDRTVLALDSMGSAAAVFQEIPGIGMFGTLFSRIFKFFSGHKKKVIIQKIADLCHLTEVTLFAEEIAKELTARNLPVLLGLPINNPTLSAVRVFSYLCSTTDSPAVELAQRSWDKIIQALINQDEQLNTLPVKERVRAVFKEYLSDNYEISEDFNQLEDTKEKAKGIMAALEASPAANADMAVTSEILKLKKTVRVLEQRLGALAKRSGNKKISSYSGTSMQQLMLSSGDFSGEGSSDIQIILARIAAIEQFLYVQVAPQVAMNKEELDS